jgi:heterodisulfide reductase subunit A
MKKSKFITDFNDIPTPRQKMPELPSQERELNFKEVELGFTEEMAVKEAKRCLSCRRCIGCGLCLAECDQKAIEYDQSPESIKLDVDSIILAPGFDEFDANRKKELGYGKCFNVVTSIEFERILSPTGPYGGVILRPSDGEIPQKVAFIQCVGSRDEMLGANFCSNLCCMQSLKEALTIQERIPDSRVTIFHKGIRPFGKSSESYYRRVVEQETIELVGAEITALDEDAGTGSVTLKYSNNGQDSEDQFDLVVLAVGLHSSASAQSLSRSTRIRLNKYSFGASSPLSPVESTEQGVFLAGGFAAPTDLSGAVTQGSAAAAKVAGILSSKRGKTLSSPGEEKQTVEVPRVGVFFCQYGAKTGGDIDLERLKKVASQLPEVEYIGESLFLCLKFGREEIQNRIADKKLNAIIVAPCYRDTHRDLFDAIAGETGVEILDIKDLSGLKDETQVKERFEASLAKIKSPEKTEVKPVTPAALVIGGGLSGMTAAFDIANQGFEVYLLEKEKTLGGWFRDKEYLLGGDLKERFDNLIANVTESEKIHLHFTTELKGVDGEVGSFKSSFSEDGREVTVECGVVVVATGAEEYKPGELLYGKDERVITQSELEQRLARGETPAGSIVMIQCVGSRDDRHPYCSRDCCRQAVENSVKIKNLRPEAEVSVLHRDIRVYGLSEDIYSEALERGVRFIKSEALPSVRNEGGLTVTAFEVDKGEEVQLKPELVVLSTGVVPPQGNRNLAEILGVPVDSDGFFEEAEAKLRPVELRRQGMFVCGLAHSPVSMMEGVAQATAVAGKAGLILLGGNSGAGSEAKRGGSKTTRRGR